MASFALRSHNCLGSRLDALLGRPAAGLALVLSVGFSCSPALAADAVLGPETALTIPIVDAHFHVMKWMDGRELLAHMDRNGSADGRVSSRRRPPVLPPADWARDSHP